MRLDRMFWQWIFGVVLVLWVLFSAPSFSLLQPVFSVFGLLLLFVGILGRLYATLYIGGMKNSGQDGKSFVCDGIYRTCRNPLYFFSFVGLLGVLCFKGQFSLLVVGGGLFLVIYRFTILSEERFLREKFGESYEEFLRSTPRFFPDFSRFSCAERLEIRPHFLHKEIKRSSAWILGAFFMYLSQILQDCEVVKAIIVVW